MSLTYYITDHFTDELKLKEQSEIVNRLNSIKRLFIVFIIINTITSFYAFHTLFHNFFITLIGTALFQFIFFMIYIVLFATIRKAEYLKSTVNKKINITHIINGQSFPAKAFTNEEQDVKTAAINKLQKSWKNITIRFLLLVFLGTGPAFFFGIMLHDRSTEEEYVKAKEQFIANQLDKSRKLTERLQKNKVAELKELIKQRNALIHSIDSLKSNPDPNGYYLEDIAWNETKLKLFDELNNQKIEKGLTKLKDDSERLAEKELKLMNSFKDADFFMLRAFVVWKKTPVTFLLSIFFFLMMLLFPFIKRYSLLIKNSEILDDLLENHYRKIIISDYEKMKYELKHSRVAEIIKELINDKEYSEIKKRELEVALLNTLNPGLNYTEPAFKTNPVKDDRKFIEKGQLAKFLGKL